MKDSFLKGGENTPSLTHSASQAQGFQVHYDSNQDSTDILIIDDTDAVLLALVKILEHQGFTVWGFQDPEEALQWYEENSSDTALVFLDLEMPKVNGKGCLERIQEINPAQKVAIMSAGRDWELIEELLERGALRFFEKPFDFDALLAWVNRELKEKRKNSPLRLEN